MQVKDMLKLMTWGFGNPDGEGDQTNDGAATHPARPPLDTIIDLTVAFATAYLPSTGLSRERHIIMETLMQFHGITAQAQTKLWRLAVSVAPNNEPAVTMKKEAAKYAATFAGQNKVSTPHKFRALRSKSKTCLIVSLAGVTMQGYS
jgi:hypothetical protein